MPWFDEGDGGRIYPLFHVVSAAAAGPGSQRLATQSSAPGRIAAIGWLEGKTARLLLANLTGIRQHVELTGASLAGATLRALDADAFAAATAGPEWMKEPAPTLDGGRLELSPYAVAFVTFRAP